MRTENVKKKKTDKHGENLVPIEMRVEIKTTLIGGLMS